MVQKSGEHQLRLAVYSIIYTVLYIPGGAGFLPSTVITPPKTNMEPENGPFQKEIPIGNHHFQVPC